MSTSAKRKRAGRAGDGRRPIFEPLEPRQVLASLVLSGTSSDDVIDVDQNSGNLVVKVNNTEIYNNPVTGFDSITIEAGDGNDAVNFNGVPSGSTAPHVINETEPNNTLGTAQNLDNAGWQIDPAGAPDPDVGDNIGNRSTIDEHITVLGTGDDTVDVYAFTVVVGSSPVEVVFDIDHTSGLFDSYIQLLNESGTVVGESDDSLLTDGAGGSVTELDSFLLHNFTVAGTYHWFLRVGIFAGLGNDPLGVPSGPDYTYSLQVIIPGHAAPSGGGTPSVLVNGGDGADTLNVASGLMQLSANPYLLAVGPLPFEGTLTHEAAEIVAYQGVETFNGSEAYTLVTDLVALGKQDGVADTTFVRPNDVATKLLVDVNGVPYFAGGIAHILIIEVNGSSDDDVIVVQNTVIGGHVSGGDGNDTITTSAGPDIVYGGGGNDVISTDGGDDYVAAGGGNDTVSGGANDDSLFGNDGDDTLSGGGGNDLVSGGAGNDQVSGQTGQDVLLGGTGADQVLGNSDRDLLFASGVVIHETGGPVTLLDADSQTFADSAYFRLQNLLGDWLDVVAGAMTLNAFNDKYNSTGDDGVEDRLQGGNGDDAFFSDGSVRIIDSQDGGIIT